MPRRGPLASLIAPLPVEVFRREVFARRAAHIVGPDDRFASLFGWGALDALLNGAPPPHPALRLYAGPAGFVPATDAASAVRLLREGATVVVNDADRYEPRLGGLVDRVEAELGEQARINVYASQPGAEGFPLHADTHDVFALQVAGRKRWRIAAPTHPDPLHHPNIPPPLAPEQPRVYLTAETTPGDVLYIPRGHWHDAVAVGEPSLHLTLAVFFSTGMDLLYHLSEVMHGLPLFRQSFPLHSGPPHRERAAPAEHLAHLAQLRAALDAVLSDPEILASMADARLGARQPRRPFALGGHVRPAPGPDTRLQAPTSAVRMGEGTGEGAFDLIVPGRRLRFPASAAPIVRALLSAGETTLAALQAALPEADPALVAEVVAGLIGEGIVRPADGGAGV